MKRTSALVLGIVAVLGIVLGWMLEIGLTGNGYPMFQLMPVYSIVLVLFAAALIALAWPIRAMQKDEKAKKVNPFWAVRVLILAQASAHSAALLGGFSLGILFWAISKAVLPAAVYYTAAAAVVAGLVLLIASLVAEHFCMLPPDDTQPQAEGQTSATG